MIPNLNEEVWAEDIIARKDLGKETFYSLVVVAKYYLSKGMSKKEVRYRVENFLTQCKPHDSIVKWSRTLDNAVICASKGKLIKIDKITITEAELSSIRELASIRCQRLAFTLLCLSKYQEIAYGIDGWVDMNTRGILSMANVSVSGSKKNMLYHEIITAGLLMPSKKVDSTYAKVLFKNEPSPEAIAVTDFRNLGYQYMRYFGGRYYECVNCGIVMPMKNKTGRPPKYCKECANKIRIKQNVESVMRQRSKAAATY